MKASILVFPGSNREGDVAQAIDDAEARVRSAVAEATVLDSKGRLCATASTTCLVFDLPVG